MQDLMDQQTAADVDFARAASALNKLMTKYNVCWDMYGADNTVVLR